MNKLTRSWNIFKKSMIVINREETPADSRASLVFHGDVIRVLAGEGILPGDG